MSLYPYKNLRRVYGESLVSYGTPVQTLEHMRGIYYSDFSTDNLGLDSWQLKYVISGLQESVAWSVSLAGHGSLSAGSHWSLSREYGVPDETPRTVPEIRWC